MAQEEAFEEWHCEVTDPLYGEKQLVDWIEQRFDLKIEPEEIGEITGKTL